MKKILTAMLTLAMIFTITAPAMAANSITPNAAVIAEREASPSWHIWFLTNRGGLQPDNRPTLNDQKELELERLLDPKFSKITDYNSPYGDPLKTWKYLQENFNARLADSWRDYIGSHIQVGSGNTVLTEPTAKPANSYLTYVTTEFGDDLIKMYDIYGSDVTNDFCKSVMCGAYFEEGQNYKIGNGHYQHDSYGRHTTYDNYVVTHELTPKPVYSLPEVDTKAITAYETSPDTGIKTDPANPNAFAVYNYTHRGYVWCKSVNNGEAPSWEFMHRDDPLEERLNFGGRSPYSGTMCSLMGSIDDFGLNYKLLPDYKSPYGDPVATWTYLNDRYATVIADRWAKLLIGAISDVRSDAITAARDNDEVDEDISYSAYTHEHATAVIANEYLEFLTENLDDSFVYLYETYGETAALNYLRSFTGYGSPSVPDDYSSCNCSLKPGKHMTGREWVETINAEIEEGYHKPEFAYPLLSTKAVDTTNMPVSAEMTLQVNGVPHVFDVMTLHNITYCKLADLSDAIGFKYHRYSIENAHSESPMLASTSCISNGAEATPRYKSSKDNGGTKERAVLVNGEDQIFHVIENLDAHGNGDTYFRIREIAEVMNFNVGWTVESGVTISNKSSFNDGLEDSFIKEYKYHLRCASRISDGARRISWNEDLHEWNYAFVSLETGKPI